MTEDHTGIKLQFDPTRQRMSGITAHGNLPFHAPVVSEIGYNLWVGGCETGLILPKNIKHLISLYPWEKYKLKHELDSNLTVKMFDEEENFSGELIDQIAAWAAARMLDGPTLIHCQAGLNRSNVVAARALMFVTGMTGREATDLLREKRSPACLCNKMFESYILSFDK